MQDRGDRVPQGLRVGVTAEARKNVQKRGERRGGLETLTQVQYKKGLAKEQEDVVESQVEAYKGESLKIKMKQLSKYIRHN